MFIEQVFNEEKAKSSGFNVASSYPDYTESALINYLGFEVHSQAYWRLQIKHATCNHSTNALCTCVTFDSTVSLWILINLFLFKASQENLMMAHRKQENFDDFFLTPWTSFIKWSVRTTELGGWFIDTRTTIHFTSIGSIQSVVNSWVPFSWEETRRHESRKSHGYSFIDFIFNIFTTEISRLTPELSSDHFTSSCVVTFFGKLMKICNKI